MAQLRGRSFVFVGRLGSMPRRAAAQRLRAFGARVRATPSRRTDCIVVGHEGWRLLDSGRLQALQRQAAGSRATLISENAFLRLVGALEPPAPESRSLALAELAGTAALDDATLRWLALFDVIEPDAAQRCGFADLVAAREVGRLMRQGITLADILAAVAALRRRTSEPGRHLARFRVAPAPDGRLALIIGEQFAEYDGQFRLPLPDDGQPATDAFADAEEAEAAGDVAAAEALYRRCLDHDRHDPTIPFNLANVLREQGRAAEARVYLRRAVELDPGMAEGWYNLADLEAAAGRPAEAKAHLRQALKLDPDYADALYNLASLLYRENDFAAAIRHWEHYLRLDPTSDWSRRAREGVGICRMQLQAARR